MNEFNNYINSILSGTTTDSKKRGDIADEVEDHLKLLKQEYIDKGYTEEEAIEMAMKSFGEVKDLRNKYTLAVNPFNKYIRIIATILFVPYMLLLIKMSFLSAFSSVVIRFGIGSINVVPFKSIVHYIFNYQNLNYDIWFNNLFGMVIAFIPFGLLIPILYNRIKRSFDIIFASALMSMCFEVFQFITNRGIADIDDIILNTLGGILGFTFLKAMVKLVSFLNKKISDRKIVED
jgi:glycopeptide antibiotics resistance protein